MPRKPNTVQAIMDARNQPETEDNLGYQKEEETLLDLPPVEVHRGPVSETLVNHLKYETVCIVGQDESGAEQTLRLSLSRCGKFINADVMVFGYPIGKFFNVAFKNVKDTWYYNKEIQKGLMSATNENHWLIKIHCYYRT